MTSYKKVQVQGTIKSNNCSLQNTALDELDLTPHSTHYRSFQRYKTK